MKSDNIYKKLRFIALCLAIVCMVISLIKRAKAEDYELQPFDSYFYDYIDTTYHITGSETIFNEFNDIPTDSWQYVEVSNSSDILGFIYNDNRLDVSNFSVTSNAYNSNELQYVTWDGRASMCSTYNLNYSDVICYLINYRIGGNGTKIYKINFGTKSYLNGSSNPYTKCSVTRTTLYSYNWQSFNSESVYGTFNISDSLKFYNYRPTFGYCYTPYGWWTAIGTGNKGIHIEFERMPNYNTSGFECYKLETKGGIYFYADYSKLITFDYSTTNTSTFTCVVHLDDSIQTITLDSSSEYYQYDVNYKEAYYSFPITAFIPNYTDYENVWIDNIIVVNTYSGHGGNIENTFYYVTPVVIQGDAYQDGNLINPDDVVIPNGEYDPPTNNEIAENTYLVEFSNKDGLTFTEFHY